MKYILTEIRDRIAYIILNRPEKRNALNAQLVEELKKSISAYQEDDKIRGIVLKSSNEVFCAGADLGYLQQLQEFTFEENLADSQHLAELFELIYNFPKPIASLVKGAAIAGGCGLATVCDLCFATSDSKFGYTESRIGFIPAIVMVYLRKKTSETQSKKILFSGEIFSANDAMSYGLITEIMATDVIDQQVHEYMVKLANHSSGNSIAQIKKMYADLESLSLKEALQYACEMNAKTRETEDCRKGISAFLNKEKISW